MEVTRQSHAPLWLRREVCLCVSLPGAQLPQAQVKGLELLFYPMFKDVLQKHLVASTHALYSTEIYITENPHCASGSDEELVYLQSGR